MTTIFSSAEERDSSSQGRLEIWAAAWEMVKQNPWGVGIGHFMQEIGHYTDNPDLMYRDAHNTYILCLGELGFFGLLAFLGILGSAWVTLSRVSRRVKQHLTDPDTFEMLVFANRLALIVFMVSGMFVSRLYTEGFWWLILLPVCISRAVENEIRVEVQEDVLLARQVKELCRRGDLPEMAFGS
jgi:O-antigen ligase